MPAKFKNPYKVSDKKKSRPKQGSCVSESDIFEENTSQEEKEIDSNMNVIQETAAIETVLAKAL